MIDNLQYLKPEIILAISAMLILMVGVFRQNKQGIVNQLFGLGIVALVVVIAALFHLHGKMIGSEPAGNIFAFDRAFIFDDFSFVMKLLISLISIAVMIIAMSSRYFAGDNSTAFEFPIIMLLSIVGMFLLVSASDLLTFYIGLELQSLAAYVLVAINRDSEKSTEAAVKYFVLGALASGIILFGTSFIYGFSSSTNLGDVAALLKANDSIQSISPGIIFGFVLIFAGLCFKLSAVPMHMWAPDVYEGATKPVVTFIATASKVAAVGFLMRFVSIFEPNIFAPFSKILVLVSAASMILGSFAALRQSNIKRLLSYSSISNMGYILIAVSLGGKDAISAGIIYIIIYMIAVIGIFAIISMLQGVNQDADGIADFAALAKSYPITSLALAILMFSVAGIPPMAGFFGKFFVFKEAVAAGSIGLAIIGVVTSVVACFYYLKIIKVMYFETVPNHAITINHSVGLKIVVTASVLFTLLMILFTGDVVKLAQAAASSLF